MNKAQPTVALFLAVPLLSFQGSVDNFEQLESLVSTNNQAKYEDTSFSASTKKRATVKKAPLSDVKWLNEFMESDPLNANSAIAVYPIVEGIRNHFLKGDFSTVNDILLLNQWQKMSPTAMVTFLTTVFSAKDKLPFWDIAIKNVSSALQHKGFSAEEILVGLI
ncbi:hypothetical protein [Pseudoalteromonas sp. XMcav11-Q]|uniref:hypothetical protein n=1 Tax=Pseudoalteromonas sp. XMcav11-Q TaxID=3136665 RepID=UPI0032C46E0B